MDRLLRRIEEALAGTPKRPRPPLPAPGTPPGTEELISVFAAAIVRAGGRLVRLGSEARARAWARRHGGGDEVGVDTADLLIAETGTVVRTYPDREASRVSLLPPISVFLATPDRIVADLPAALAALAPRHAAGRAYTVLVTGPSRTADIEKELVIPAHGPRELVVLLHA